MTREKAIRMLESYIGNECYTGEWQAVCRMAIAALCAQQEMGWISAKDKLPEYNKVVIVIWIKHDQIRRMGFGTLQSHGVWYVHNEGMPPVTHWRPLPEPPKEEHA